MVTISKLWCYPVKSCQGIAVDTLSLDRFGATGDRRWMVVNEQRKFVTQRQCPRMGQIKVAWDGFILELRAPGMPVLRLPGELAKLAGTPVHVAVWHDHCEALDQGDQAANWLSQWLGEPVRLVAMPDNTIRYVDAQFAKSNETVSFSDGFQLLLTSQSSLEQLCNWLGRDIEMERFRPNVAIKGAMPWAEDNLTSIIIDGQGFQLVKPCSRCVIPSLNLKSGICEPDVLETLKRYRKGQDGMTYFGQNVLYRALSGPVTTLSVGQTVLA